MRDWCEKDDGDERLREEERVLRKRRKKKKEIWEIFVFTCKFQIKI